MEIHSELTRLRNERDAARSQLAVEKQAHQRDVDQMRIDWANDTDRLRAELASAKAEIEAVREGGMCALSIAEEDHAHTKVALAAERERVEAWKDLFSDEAERTTKLRAALEPLAKAAENFDDFLIKNAEEWFVYSGQQSHNETRGAITVGDLRRARDALAETGGGDE